MIERPIWWDYAEFYPYEDEEGYDGVHDGGLKGVSDDAPDEIKNAFKEYKAEMEEAERRGIKL